ncbi:MAG TPA: hypothetical protein VMV52_07220 [Candidatus Nanopelagicaceae bacterium]|nr:hypothetical protein [Candidatus Nanopelagicaceae bacterium]
MNPQKGLAPSSQTEPQTDDSVATQAQAWLEQAIPPGWKIETEKLKETSRKLGQADALLRISNGISEQAKFVVEIKKQFVSRDIATVLEQLKAVQAQIDNAAPMIIARYISESVQRSLRNLGVSYADATGNLQIIYPKTSTYIRDVGAKSDPWRGPGRPRNSLRGAPASRVLQSLIEVRPPFSIPQIIKIAKSSSGVTYRVIEYLERENLLTLVQNTKGPKPKQEVKSVLWRETIERWSQDYEFQSSNDVQSFVEPRGMETLLKKLKSISSNSYAITGSLSANIYSPYANPKLAMIYAKDVKDLASTLQITPVSTGANVLLAATDHESIFEDTKAKNGLIYVSIVQTALDLLTSPGRGPSEGEELLNWMESHQDEWRR